MHVINTELIDSHKLRLDEGNVRFYHVSGVSAEEALLMIERKHIQELVNSMLEKGFDPVFPLHSGKDFVIKDGNTRLLSYWISTGVGTYQKLAEKYSIKGFGELKTLTKLPVRIYDDNTQLERFVMEQHLNPTKSDWSSSAKYSFYSKLYKERASINFPGNIKIIVLSVDLYINAIEVSNTTIRNKLQTEYEKNITVLYRLFQNIKLIEQKNKKQISLFKALGISLDDQRNILYSSLLDEDEWSVILSEVSIFMLNNIIGGVIRDIAEFPKTFSILEKTLNIKSTRPAYKKNTSNLEDKKTVVNFKISNSKVENEQSQAFFINNNLSISDTNLLNVSSIESKSLRQRVILENSIWVFISIYFKKKMKCDSYDFLENIDVSNEKVTANERQLYKLLIKYYRGTEVKLSEIISTIKKANLNNSNLVESEIVFLNFLTYKASSEIVTLNNAAHGKWDSYETEIYSTKLDKILKNVLNYWKGVW